MDIDKKWLAAALILLLLAFAGGAKYEAIKLDQKKQAENLVQEDSKGHKAADTAALNEGIIQIYVTGEVKRPGVYRLSEGDRLFQAVELAGGSLEKADLEHQDMARKLVDGETIDISAIGETPEPVGSSGASSTGANSSGKVNTPGRSGVGGKVNINTASLTELDTLDGIGPTLAQRIIDYRTANGPFAAIEDINNVSGIGDKKFEAIKGGISVR